MFGMCIYVFLSSPHTHLHMIGTTKSGLVYDCVHACKLCVIGITSNNIGFDKILILYLSVILFLLLFGGGVSYGQTRDEQGTTLLATHTLQAEKYEHV